MIIHPHSDYSWPSKALSFGTCSWWDSTCISWGSTIVPVCAECFEGQKRQVPERFRLSDNFIVGGYGPASGFPESCCRRSHGNTFLVVSSSNRFFWYWNPVQFSLLSPSNAFFLSRCLHPRMEMTRVLFSLMLLLCAWYKEWGASTCCLSLLKCL